MMEKFNGLKSCKYALLILGMQNDYGFDKNSINESIIISLNSACEFINIALDLFRKKNLPIIWLPDDIEDVFESPTMDFIGRRNFGRTGNFGIMDKLRQNKMDKIITKKNRDGFKETGLLEYIKENEIDTLIITGFSAEYDILDTYKTAENYNLKPKILKNGIAGIFNGGIGHVEKICEIITINELEKIIE
jgi:nicotinamidase-related amidase